MLALVIRNATIYDGTGSPWFRSDVGVQARRVSAIGAITQKARKTIDASGLALCPGFVDVHTHTDGIVECPTAENVLRQGVTTVVSGNCGSSAFPVGQMLDRVDAAKPAINYATLVGHGTVRTRVMGAGANRKPTRAELAQMRRLIGQAMREGAVGMSTGLFYVPGAYADIDEIVEVSKAAADHGGVYASHARSAGGKLFEAIREAAAIGKRAKISVEVSHLKVLHKRGRTRSGRAAQVLSAIGEARADGVDVTFDVYPYDASSTSLASAVLPAWASEGGKQKDRLRDAAMRRRMRDEAASNIAWLGGAGRITISSFAPDRSIEGATLADVAKARKRSAVYAAMDLILEGRPSAIFHSFRDRDVAEIIAAPFGMIASDGSVVASKKRLVHPRAYGTFPRALREFVIQRNVLSMAEAIRKMTSLPARKFGIANRGLIAPGMWADLVLFDPAKIADRATVQSPHRFPTGIRSVVVNGHVAWDGARLSRKRTGIAIRKE